MYGMVQEQIIAARMFGIAEIDHGFEIKVPLPYIPSTEYKDLSNKADSFLQKNDIEKATNILQRFIDNKDIPVKNKAMAYNELGKIYMQYVNPIRGIEYLTVDSSLKCNFYKFI